VLTELLRDIDRKQEPAAILSDLVDQGRHGVKTGRGVYDWSTVNLEQVMAERDQRLLDQLEVYHAAHGPPNDTGE
jgi:3-hydroxyacyl-CoA dehydrogenase